MANDYRNESRRRPPLEKYGTPGTQYPTPNPYDVVITEEVTSRAQAFEPVIYGTPHPVVSAAVLCHQSPVKSGNTDKAPVRIYANPRLAQEPYNLVNGDDEANDQAFPTFIRSYLLPRGYTPATIGNPLTALIGLTLVSGGSGYTSSAGSNKIPLAFTGGTGSGATGYGEVVGGEIVAVVLTNGGSYTAVPTVSAAGGAGLSVTALLQPVSALLISEQEQPAEEPFGGWFVRVTRVYETIPGKPISTQRYDPESGAMVTTTKRKNLLADIDEGVTHLGAGVNSYVQITESDQLNALIGMEMVTVLPLPEAHSEETAILSEESLPFQFPGTLDVFQWLTYSGLLGATSGFVKRVPHIKKTWWEFSETKPALTLTGVIDFGQMYTFLGSNLGETIYDATDELELGALTYDFPGSVPDLTEYLADWVGGEPRSVLGSVRPDGGKFRWRVEKIFVQFIMLRPATLNLPDP